MENLIEKINLKGQQIRNQRQLEINEKRERVIQDIEKTKALIPRIKKLWEIGQTLLNNGFNIGKPHHAPGSTYYEYETNGWYHWLGFFVRNNEIYGFGECGGGCCGKSVRITHDGTIMYGDKIANADDDCLISRGDNYSPRAGKMYENVDFTHKLSRILNGFDDFEKGVLDFAESIVNQ